MVKHTFMISEHYLALQFSMQVYNKLYFCTFSQRCINVYMYMYLYMYSSLKMYDPKCTWFDCQGMINIDLMSTLRLKLELIKEKCHHVIAEKKIFKEMDIFSFQFLKPIMSIPNILFLF